MRPVHIQCAENLKANLTRRSRQLRSKGELVPRKGGCRRLAHGGRLHVSMPEVAGQERGRRENRANAGVGKDIRRHWHTVLDPSVHR